jgi:predicted ATPase with chaperone activity
VDHTLADRAGSENISRANLAEALSYRQLHCAKRLALSLKLQ